MQSCTHSPNPFPCHPYLPSPIPHLTIPSTIHPPSHPLLSHYPTSLASTISQPPVPQPFHILNYQLHTSSRLPTIASTPTNVSTFGHAARIDHFGSGRVKDDSDGSSFTTIHRSSISITPSLLIPPNFPPFPVIYSITSSNPHNILHSISPPTALLQQANPSPPHVHLHSHLLLHSIHSTHLPPPLSALVDIV